MATPDSPSIAAHGVGRVFGHFVAVKNLDLEVLRGEVFGLLGANGAGKTTAIRMLCGTLSPSSGSVRVAGVDMVADARLARAHIGYVTQRFTLYGDLSARENLELQAGLYGVAGERLQRRLRWALERLELGPVANERAARLPLGFQRRLAVAAALLHEPGVLSLDEPTSGIDPLARQQLWELVYELAAAGVGVLVTTHYMDEALFCDRLALMDRGEVIATGTPQSLRMLPLATPLVELRAAHDGAMTDWLGTLPEVLEVLPRAGRLRVRLRQGTAAQTFIAAATSEAARRGLGTLAAQPAQAELEDVFVLLLESHQPSP